MALVAVGVIWGEHTMNIVFAITVTAPIAYGLGWEMGQQRLKDKQKEEEEAKRRGLILNETS